MFFRSAKVIKQNGPDIGRKVKKKMDQIPPPLNRRETSPFSHAKFSPNNSSSTNTKTTNASSLGHSSSNSSINRTFNGFNSVGNNNSGINTRPAGSCKPGIGPADIAKRPLKCVFDTFTKYNKFRTYGTFKINRPLFDIGRD